MLYNFPVVPHVKKQKHHSNVKECMRKSSLSAINICLLFTTRIQPGAFVWPHKSGSEWLQMPRMNMAISHIALQHFLSEKRLLFVLIQLVLLCFLGLWIILLEGLLKKSSRECLRSFDLPAVPSSATEVVFLLPRVLYLRLHFSSAENLHSRTLGLYATPPSGQLSRTTHSGDFRPQIMKGIWKKCKCKEHNLLIMLNDFTFNMYHLNSNICNANVCMTWTPKESMCRPFDTAIRPANAEPPL